MLCCAFTWAYQWWKLSSECFSLVSLFFFLGFWFYIFLFLSFFFTFLSFIWFWWLLHRNGDELWCLIISNIVKYIDFHLLHLLSSNLIFFNYFYVLFSIKLIYIAKQNKKKRLILNYNQEKKKHLFCGIWYELYFTLNN